jgi:hypothetical protein
VTWARPSDAERRRAREQEKNRNMRALLDRVPLVRRGTYSGSTNAAAPKTEPYRDAVLLEMARGRPCLLMVPGACTHRLDQTVACHSNLSIHGKAGSRKADDCYSCWGCAACHRWLDQGRADAFLKETAFMQAHLSQVLAWRQIAADQGEPERFRRAACRALERLGATPLGVAR